MFTYEVNQKKKDQHKIWNLNKRTYRQYMKSLLLKNFKIIRDAKENTITLKPLRHISKISHYKVLRSKANEIIS